MGTTVGPRGRERRWREKRGREALLSVGASRRAPHHPVVIAHRDKDGISLTLSSSRIVMKTWFPRGLASYSTPCFLGSITRGSSIGDPASMNRVSLVTADPEEMRIMPPERDRCTDT